MLTFLAALLLAQAAPQSDADKMEAALKRIGDRTYSVMAGGKKIGTAVLRTRLEQDKGKSVVIIEDHLSIGEGEAELKLKETASVDGLRILSAEGTTKEGERSEKWNLAVDGKKVKIAGKDPEVEFDITDSTVSEHSVIRFLAAAEQKVGASFKLDVLSYTAEEVNSGQSFRCLAKEQVEIGGRKVDAFKWESKGEWKRKRKVGDQEREVTSQVDDIYWISPEGYLLRTTNGQGMEVTLE